jgi:L-cysteine S-thiosulfotransferase
MKNYPSSLCFALPLLALLLVSCGDERERLSKGFRLPEGDVERGKVAFVELKCHQCHSVDGVDIPGIAAGAGQVLGGKIERVKTYGELVTAIIDPQHNIAPSYTAQLDESKRETARSPMPPYNEIMTVKQLTDIVTFLHSRYEKLGPEYQPYIYHMP